MRRPKIAITPAISGAMSASESVSCHEIRQSITTPIASASAFCTSSAKIRSSAEWARVASLIVRESISPRDVPWCVAEREREELAAERLLDVDEHAAERPVDEVDLAEVRERQEHARSPRAASSTRSEALLRALRDALAQLLLGARHSVGRRLGAGARAPRAPRDRPEPGNRTHEVADAEIGAARDVRQHVVDERLQEPGARVRARRRRRPRQRCRGAARRGRGARSGGGAA